MDEYSAMLAYG